MMTEQEFIKWAEEEEKKGVVKANVSYEEALQIEEKERLKIYEDSYLSLFESENRGVIRVEDIKIDLNKLYDFMDDSDEGNEYYIFAKSVYVRDYGEELGIKLTKIYKYMTRLGEIIRKRYESGEIRLLFDKMENGECIMVNDVYSLILQKISFMHADLINGKSIE